MPLTKIQLTEIAENIDAGLHCYIDLKDWSIKSIPDPKRHNRDDESWDATEKKATNVIKNNHNLLVLRGVPKMENHQIMTQFIPTVDSNTVKDQLRAAAKKKRVLHATPVLPTSDLIRDTEWYKIKLGFTILQADTTYAVLRRSGIYIHLQWHADTNEDPLLGGSVVKIFVKNIETLFEEFVEKGIITDDKLRKNTPWNTHEFGLYDLNRNAIFFVEDIVIEY